MMSDNYFARDERLHTPRPHASRTKSDILPYSEPTTDYV